MKLRSILLCIDTKYLVAYQDEQRVRHSFVGLYKGLDMEGTCVFSLGQAAVCRIAPTSIISYLKSDQTIGTKS